MKILGIPCNAFEAEGQEKSAFYNHEGWLSPYALECGYQEKIDFWGDDPNVYLTATLYKDGCYHVRYWNQLDDERVWNSYDNLADARINFKYHALKLITEVQEHHTVEHGFYNKLNPYREEV